MNILPRVRYILEVFLPQGPVGVLIQLLQILQRIARHSTAAATQVSHIMLLSPFEVFFSVSLSLQVLNCPRLIPVVFEQFLPLSWVGEDQGGSPTHSQTSPGTPHVAAFLLVKALCVAGRNIASQLVESAHVCNRLPSHLLFSRFRSMVFSL